MPTAKPAILVATLGGQPQVVTLAVDALLRQDINLIEVIVVYLSPSDERIRHALRKLETEFAGGFYQGAPITYRPVPVRGGRQILRDIHDEQDANVAWDVIHHLIAQLKMQQQTLHVCISGGRRILGLLTMSAAMLHFGHHDVLWHMYTPDALRRQTSEGALMHLPPDSGFRLIRVPMMPWGSYFPALRQLARPVTPGEDVLAGPRAVLDMVEQRRCQAVIAALTDRQQDVLTVFANGLSPQEAAERLNITIKTVDSHKTVILAECRNAWSLAEDHRLDYRFLADKFGLYFHVNE